LTVATAVGLSLDGRLVASAEGSGIVKVWSAGPGRELAQDRTWQWDVQFSPDGRLAANCPFHQGVVIRSARSGRELMRIHTPNESFFVAAFSPDGRRLATVGTQKTGKVWDLETGQLVLRLRGHRRQMGPVVYSDDGRRIATGSLDGTAKIWDAQTGQELLTLQMDPQRGYALTGLSNGVACLVFDAKGERLLTGGGDGKARIWEVATGRLLRTLDPGEKTTTIEGCFLPDPRYVITDADKRIQIWEVSSGRLVAQVTGRGACRGAAVSRDGRRWFVASAEAMSSHATVSGHSTLEIWDIEQSPRRILELPGSALFAWLELSPDDRTVACPAIDFCVHRRETFPWREEEYPESGGQKSEVSSQKSAIGKQAEFADRVRQYARRYWRERLDWELNGAEGEPAEPRIMEVPLDRALFAKRDPSATTNQIDLTDFYTGELGETFHGKVCLTTDHDDDLSELSTGLMRLGGVEFDIRGVIQVRRTESLGGPWELAASDDPVRVDTIRVRQDAVRLHLLLGTFAPEADGTVIGRLRLHYDDGESRPLDLVYGRDVRDWWFDPTKTDTETTDRAKIVWTGLNPVANEYGRRLRLYLNTRENPRPGVKISSFDFVSTMSKSAPFLIALTVE
jgi:WD40 repeat protein